MTALDRAFIKAYGRPRRASAGQASQRPPAPAGVALQRGDISHRIDPPAVLGSVPSVAPVEPADKPSLAPLPSVEQIHEHALAFTALPEMEVQPPPELSATAKAAVAATAADLHRAWPPRFASDSVSLLDGPAVKNVLPSGTTSAGPVEPASPAPATQPASASTLASAAKPLSAFAPTEPLADPVAPLLEVDRFEWPSECQAVCAAVPAALDQFISRLMSAAAEGAKRVALLGIGPAAGATTAALCLARRAAGQGANWVLVDADIAKARLAGRLGVLGQAGWPRVLGGELELGEVMIASLEDRFTVVPGETLGLDAEPWTGARGPEVFDLLADAYELVLVDAGTVVGSNVAPVSALSRAAHLAAVYLVYDGRRTTVAELSACARRLSEAGLTVAGAIENFAPRSDDAAPR